MKPYLIGKVWVDLDHIQAVDDQLTTPRGSYAIGGYITLAFQGDLYWVQLGTLRYVEEANRYVRDLGDGLLKSSAEFTWAAFKTAWKTKDTMFGGSK